MDGVRRRKWLSTFGSGTGMTPGSTLATSFEPEAYYWFLYPLIEKLRDSHRKYIDLYGGCAFTPQELGLIRELISDAERLVQQQPNRFRVHVGTQTDPGQRGSA